MLSFNRYVETVDFLNGLAQKVNDLEGFLEALDESVLTAEEVTSGDIAQVTLPLMTLRRRKVYEKAPPDKSIEDDFIKPNKSRFRRLYGDDWEQILYATAWNIYNRKKKK